MAISDAIHDHLSQYCVQIACNVVRPDGSRPEAPLIVSAFIVEAADRWFVVSAGHVLTDIRSFQRQGFQFGVCYIRDAAAPRFENMGVPIDLDPDQWIVCDPDEHGLDYAALPLRDYYRHTLSQSGFKPLSRSGWGDPSQRYDYMVVIGVPEMLVSAQHGAVDIVKMRQVAIPLVPCEPPSQVERKHELQFFARMDESANHLTDIGGMSGSPVFGIRWLSRDEGDKEHTLQCWAVGVQSGWYKSSRVISAYAMEIFGQSLEALVRDRSRSASPARD